MRGKECTTQQMPYVAAIRRPFSYLVSWFLHL
jgi:hypothetical protein